MHNKQEIKAIDEIAHQLRAAKIKHPVWPENHFEQINILTEELGELAQAMNDLHSDYKTTYKTTGGFDFSQMEKIRKEAAQVGAMAVRFLSNFPVPNPDEEGI